MTKEYKPKDEQNEKEGGFPVQAILMLSVLGLSLVVLLLKFMGAI